MNNFSSNKIKVLHVTQFLAIGGLETVIIDLCKTIDKNSFEVEVLCLNGYEKLCAQRLSAENIPVHLITKESRYDFRFFLKVSRFIKNHKIDVIHAHSGCFFYAAVFSLLAKTKKFIYTAHGLPILNRLQDIVEDNLASFAADTIVAVSFEIRERLAHRTPFARNKLKTIINGIDCDIFRPTERLKQAPKKINRYGLSSNIFWIGSVGRIEPVKNYPMLLRAVARMKSASPRPVGLVLVGDGSQLEEIKNLATELGIEQKVKFLGKQYRIQEILPLLDVFALPSTTEGTSIALLEAQASGVPAVVTNVGGNGYIIKNGWNGYLCEANDIDSMANHLDRLYNSPEILSAMKINSRKLIKKNFKLDSMTKQYQALYTKK